MEKSDLNFRQITDAALWKLNEGNKTKEPCPVERENWGREQKTDRFEDDPVKYQFSIAVVTNYHRFSGLNNTNLSLQFCRLEI